MYIYIYIYIYIFFFFLYSCFYYKMKKRNSKGCFLEQGQKLLNAFSN